MPRESCTKSLGGAGWSLLRRFAFLLLIMQTLLSAFGQPPGGGAPPAQANAQEPEVTEDEQTAPGHVIIDGREILEVYESVAQLTPQQRADKITKRIIAIAQDPRIPPESVTLASRDEWTEISAGDTVLMAVTDTDARMAGKPRRLLSAEYAQNIRQAVVSYRHDHSWGELVSDILFSMLATILLIPVVWLVRKLRFVMKKWIQARTEIAAKKTAWQVAVTYAISVLVTTGTVLRWLLILALFEVYLTVVLSFFPQTRFVSHAITDWILAALGKMGNAALDYLPNLFVIAVVAVVASQLFRLISMVFAEISKGNLTIGGFYPEWAAPTARLVRMLVLVLVVIVIFPYLPGSKSPAFQGISIFVGVLLSLGSSSAVANAIAGVILTYMRSLAVGDWVKIGDVVGEVVEKNMLVTRVLTMKQEIITIPNATVMNGSVMNYTREAKNQGVIFHTIVSIGYDTPWTTVHQLLIDAALATRHTLHNPAPFVLQTALNDFYVSYELNAYTDVPREMQFIYSDLHQNIQNKFNEAGVEICSPHFSALRDGNTITIPEQYRPPGYSAPGFRVDGASKEEAEQAGKGR